MIHQEPLHTRAGDTNVSLAPALDCKGFLLWQNETI